MSEENVAQLPAVEAEQRPPKSDAQRATDVELAAAKLLALSGVEAALAVQVEGEGKLSVFVEVKKGEELFSAAPEGEVLAALEYLTLKVAGRDDTGRFSVTFTRTDTPAVPGEAEVEPVVSELGVGLAGWVVRHGRPMTLLGLPSHERKALHAAIGADGRVVSKSEGEGAGRRLVVSLRRGGEG